MSHIKVLLPLNDTSEEQEERKSHVFESVVAKHFSGNTIGITHIYFCKKISNNILYLSERRILEDKCFISIPSKYLGMSNFLRANIS